MRIIAINGAKHSKKDYVAQKLAMNSDCVWVKPYTDKEKPVNLEDYEEDEYIHLNESKLSYKMEREVPLCEIVVNGHRWVFFENQFTAGYCVIIADDRVISYLKENWDGDLVTLKVHSKDEIHSNRCLLPDEEYDLVFNVDTGDFDELEALVGDIFFFKE